MRLLVKLGDWWSHLRHRTPVHEKEIRESMQVRMNVQGIQTHVEANQDDMARRLRVLQKEYELMARKEPKQ